LGWDYSEYFNENSFTSGLIDVLELYPIPTSDEVSLTILTDNKTRNAKVSIFNTDGELSKTIDIEGENGNIIMSTFDVQDLADGYHFVRIITDKNEIFSSSLVKI